MAWGVVALLFLMIGLGIPIGFEHGFFIWLFALMAVAITFVQLRVWQPKSVYLITAFSLTGLIYKGIDYVY